MPIYQFYCSNCKIEFKQILSFDERISDCYKCGENCERRIPTSTNIINKTPSDNPGKRVEKYIEENREIVSELIKEIKRDYEP